MKKIELLGPQLLSDTGKVREIDRWLAVMDRPNGWHYDLDIIWLLQNLERSGITPGMTVLDAGAGLGVTQYVLAARGYRVISLDYSQRAIPKRAAGIFTMSHASAPVVEYSHRYQSHMRFVGAPASVRRRLGRLLAEPIISALAIWDRRRAVARQFSKLAERRRDHSHFGPIEFLWASFHQIPLADRSVDAVVSVSAVEHSDKAIIVNAIAEMRRVTRPGGPILITTSAAPGSDDVFHEPTQAICFCRRSLTDFAGSAAACEFDCAGVERDLLASELLWSRVDPYYYRWPWALFHNQRRPSKLPYLPVGLRVQ